MKCGIMFRSGDIAIATIQFTDTFEIKKRPVLILFEEYGNYVVAGITSNINMKGIPILQKEGMIKDSIIKTNYIFTISEKMISKRLFHLNKDKRNLVFETITKQLNNLLD